MSFTLTTLVGTNVIYVGSTTGAVSATPLTSVISYVDVTSSTGAAAAGVATGSFGSATIICPAPSSGVARCVKNIIIRNVDSVSIALTVGFSSATAFLRVTLESGETLEWVEANGWRKLKSDGTVIGKEYTGFVDVQTFTTGGYYTWTKPTSFIPNFVRVIMWGGGGGGGGGGALASATATARFGGCGGGGGAFVDRTLPASMVGISEPVKVGLGGKGGKGGASGVAGINGVDGEPSLFGDHVFAGGGGYGRLGPISLLASQGGSGGGSGGNGQSGGNLADYLVGGFPNRAYSWDASVGYIGAINGSGGTGGAYGGYPAQYGGGGGSGHPNTLPYTAKPGGPSWYGGGGGGLGGFTNATPTVQSGSAGGLSGLWDTSQTVKGAAAGACGPTPGTGSAGADGVGFISGSVPPIGGGGGGGGGSTVTANTAGARGGDGGARGGGGGGGGAGCNTGRGGDGGDGGRGEVIVITW